MIQVRPVLKSLLNKDFRGINAGIRVLTSDPDSTLRNPDPDPDKKPGSASFLCGKQHLVILKMRARIVKTSSSEALVQ